MIINKAEKIEFISPDLVIPWEKNANKHPDEQIARLCKIIQFNGFRDPLIISKRSGFLICGHARLVCAKLLKIEKVPVIYQDFRDEAEEYQFMVAHNAIADWADLNLEAIKLESIELKMDDLELFGLKQDLKNVSFVADQSEDKENDNFTNVVFKYVLEIECGDEETQKELMSEMEDRGFKVRPLI